MLDAEDDEISRAIKKESRRFCAVIGGLGAVVGLALGLWVGSVALGELMIAGGCLWAIGCLGLAVFL